MRGPSSTLNLKPIHATQGLKPRSSGRGGKGEKGIALILQEGHIGER